VIPDRVFAWAQEELDRPISSVVPVGGGLTNTISAINFADGDPVILRHHLVPWIGCQMKAHRDDEVASVFIWHCQAIARSAVL